MDLSTWFPQMPYFNSAGFGHGLEDYYTKRDACWEELDKYDALLLAGGSGPMVDMVNNERLHDVILGFLAKGKAHCSRMLLRDLPGLRPRLDRTQEHHRRKTRDRPRPRIRLQGRHRLRYHRGVTVNFGPPFYPLEYILRDAVGPDGQYHGGVGHTLSTILDYPFLTGRSTQDSQRVGELIIQVLEKGLRRYGW